MPGVATGVWTVLLQGTSDTKHARFYLGNVHNMTESISVSRFSSEGVYGPLLLIAATYKVCVSVAGVLVFWKREYQ
jgi:hypothetical protein